MKEFIKKNFAIVLAFALPILLIIIIALSTYVPSLFLSTDYNFVYSTCDQSTTYYPYQCDNYLQKRYSVVDNKLVVNNIYSRSDSDNNGIPDIDENYKVHFFLYNTTNNESREITIEEVQKLNLSSLLTSPDGVTVSNHYDRNGNFFFLFNGNSSHGYYLTKGNAKNKLNLVNQDNRYYREDKFHFIGWVLPNRS